jgi:hypothetical protein
MGQRRFAASCRAPERNHGRAGKVIVPRGALRSILFSLTAPKNAVRSQVECVAKLLLIGDP